MRKHAALLKHLKMNSIRHGLWVMETRFFPDKVMAEALPKLQRNSRDV